VENDRWDGFPIDTLGNNKGDTFGNDREGAFGNDN